MHNAVSKCPIDRYYQLHNKLKKAIVNDDKVLSLKYTEELSELYKGSEELRDFLN